jgi:hypothetical protein
MKERSADLSSPSNATYVGIAALALGAMFAGQAAAGENPCVQNTSVTNWLTVPACEVANGIANEVSGTITSIEVATLGHIVGIPEEAVVGPDQGNIFSSSFDALGN